MLLKRLESAAADGQTRIRLLPLVLQEEGFASGGFSVHPVIDLSAIGKDGLALSARYSIYREPLFLPTDDGTHVPAPDRQQYPSMSSDGHWQPRFEAC